MARYGIDSFYVKDGDSCYDLLGAKTVFRLVTGTMVENTVEGGKWFSFCTRISDSQVDIMREKNSKGIKIGSYVAEIYPETVYRSAVYKYLLRDYLCYYEVPTVTKNTASTFGYKSTYDKYLVTSNLEVVARWLNIDIEEASALYGSRLEEACDDNGCDLFPYLKLYETKDGVRKITKPRKDLDLSLAGTRVLPVFALEKAVNMLYRLACNDFYSIEFVKDGGQVRSLNTTFNVDKLREIYGETDFFHQGIEAMYNGDFESNPYMERGYFRVFEAGSSKYDSPTRAVNYARIVSFKKEEPDLTYINIDISSVVDIFKSSINNVNVSVEEIVSMLDIFNVGTERKVHGKDIKTTQDLENWVDSQEVLLSTVFLRSLALFMLGNSHWFGGYNGKSTNEKTYISTGEDLDSMDDFDFDIM